MAPNKEKSVVAIILEDLEDFELTDINFEEPDEAQLNNK